MVDGQATRIRTVGDAIVLVGGVASHADDADRTVTTRPALWASVAGSPFERTILPSLPDPGGAATHPMSPARSISWRWSQ